VSSIPFYLTPAGRALLVNPDNTGTNALRIAQVGISAAATGIVAGKLSGEIKRLTTFAGDVVADDTIHVTIRDDSADVYSLRAFALYTETGVLLGSYSQAGVIMEKSAQAMMLLSTDIQFLDLNVTAVTFGESNWINPAATTETPGVVEIADNAESVAGTDDRRAMSPAGTKAALDARLGVGAPTGFVKTLMTAGSAAVFRAGLALKSAATFDTGAGKGLDADLLDGQHGAYYLNYANLTGVPATFAPSAHKHAWADLTGLPAYATRWPSHDEVTDKPSKYPPENHTHSAADINSGTFDAARIPSLPISRTTGLQTALDGKSANGHGHAISDVVGLQAALDSKSANGHGHAIGDVTGLQTALDGKAASNHTHSAQQITSGTFDVSRIPALGISNTTGLQAQLDRAVRVDVALNTIAPGLADFRLAAGTAAGSDTLSLRLQSGGGYNTGRGAILELNGVNAAANGGAFRLLASDGSTSLVSGGAGSTVLFQSSTYNFTGPLQRAGQDVWWPGNFTPTNVPVQVGDFLVSKSSSIIGIGVSGGRNGGMCNFANDGIGDIGLFSEHVGGRIRLRPDGRLSSVGQFLVETTGVNWNGNTVYHSGLFKPGDFAAAVHTHTVANVTGLQTALDSKAATARQLVAGNGLTGGGTLQADRTLTLGTPSTVTGATANSVATQSHTHALSLAFNAESFDAGSADYPQDVVSTGSLPAGSASGISTHLTMVSGGNARVAQLLFQPSGGTGQPTLMYRTSHTSAGGGGWTGLQKVWTDATLNPASFASASHSHSIAQVTGLQSALDGKQASGSYAAATHNHSIAQVTGLQSALDGKQPSGSYAAAAHSHTIANVTGLQAALNACVKSTEHTTSNAKDGWRKGPDGIIEQWGYVSTYGAKEGESPGITFPIPFPNACHNVSLTAIIPGPSILYDLVPQCIGEPTLTGQRVFLQAPSDDSPNGYAFYWRAIGH